MEDNEQTMSDDIDSLASIINVLSEILKKSQQSDSIINIVSVLWIILFTIILSQKVIKYIIKPRIRCNNIISSSSDNDNDNNERDPSTERICDIS